MKEEQIKNEFTYLWDKIDDEADGFSHHQEEIETFILDVAGRVRGDAINAIELLRDEQPSNIAHPDYYKCLNEWEARELVLLDAEDAVNDS